MGNIGGQEMDFEWQSNAAWGIFQQADLKAADHYFRTHNKQDFTVIQATV